MSFTTYNRILRNLKLFLSKYLDGKGPVLLGLSGGPDSMLLFHLLKMQIPFHVVHIDHQVRHESKKEAELLQSLAEDADIPFYLATINPAERNFEDDAREQRYTIFKKIADEVDAQAVILGHHADDQAETVLKRCFEGGLLSSLGVLTPNKTLYGLKVLRPLLPFTKGEILKALEEEGFTYFDDPTNHDGSNLRSRFRKQIIPLLAETFGKNISKGLCLLADDIQEFNTYMESRIEIYPIIQTETNVVLDLTEKCPDNPLELKYLLRKFFKIAGLSPSRNQIETASELINDSKSKKKISFGDSFVTIDKRYVQF